MKRLLVLAMVLSPAITVRALDDGPQVATSILSRQWKGEWIVCANAPARESGAYRSRRDLAWHGRTTPLRPGRQTLALP
jgi:hypothetical protein